MSEIYRVHKVTHLNGTSGYYQVDRDGVMVAIFNYWDPAEVTTALARATAAVDAMRALECKS